MDDTLTFHPSKSLSLGVEMELQLLDQGSFDLSPVSPKILEIMDNPKVKAEIFQSMIEVNTDICANAHEVREDLIRSIGELEKCGRKLGIRLASAGTHPEAHYSERKLFPANRYMELVDRNQWIARRLAIFGLHVHLGMRNGDHAIAMNNALLHYLPMLLALSASSPYWAGEDTELASSRITFFEAIPTGGHPCRLLSWDHYTALMKKLLMSEAIRSTKDVWWDLRICPDFGTIEIRICDGLPTLSETVAVTALIHAMAVHFEKLIDSGAKFDPPSDWVMRENKWRASRWGVDARMISDEYGSTLPFRELFENLVAEIQPTLASFNYQHEIDLLRQVLDLGPSYLRQRLVAAKHDGDLRRVTEHLAHEFTARAPIWDK